MGVQWFNEWIVKQLVCVWCVYYGLIAQHYKAVVYLV